MQMQKTIFIKRLAHRNYITKYKKNIEMKFYIYIYISLSYRLRRKLEDFILFVFKPHRKNVGSHDHWDIIY